MNILLTGANGFIGQRLIQYIKQKSDYNLILLTSREIQGYKCVMHNNYKFSKQDFTDNGVEHIDVLIHLGAYTPKNSKHANNIEQNTLNIYNTIHLIKNLVSMPKKIVYISTVSVYPSTDEIINENTQVNPDNMYSLSKLYCEKIIKTYCEKNNIRYQILRLGQVYGIGDQEYDALIPSIIRKLLNGENLVIINGGQALRSPIHVKDCCRCIYKSIELGTNIEKSKIVNIVTGKSYRVIEIVNLLIKISGENIKPLFAEQENEISSNRFDNTKMIELFGKEEACFEDELAKEYAYFKSLQGS